MTQAPVSLIIVSRDRAASLGRTLKSLAFQTHPNFEVIVVSNTPQTDAVCKWIDFDEANISKARNLGIAEAAGEIIAFCDDDAVPDPNWLTALTAPIATGEAGVAGGFVRGRNGISYQWEALETNALGEDRALAMSGDLLLRGIADGWVPKVQGTNCAFDAALLAEAGGFDPRFKFLFDETDLAYRLAGTGAQTALMRGAEVHHGFAESAQRSKARLPLNLSVEMQSKRLFLQKHAPRAAHPAALDRFRHMQEKRLIKHLIAGTLGPMTLRKMRADMAGSLPQEEWTPTPIPRSTSFKPFPAAQPKEITLLTCRSLAARATHQEAKRRAAAGEAVLMLALSPTSLFHRRYFHENGYWVQEGGRWGRSYRSEALFQYAGFQDRCAAETEKMKAHRQIFF